MHNETSGHVVEFVGQEGREVVQDCEEHFSGELAGIVLRGLGHRGCSTHQRPVHAVGS